MTNAELKFMETVPASLHRLAAATEKIAEALSRANRLKALHIMVECGSPGFNSEVFESLCKELGFIKDSAGGDGGNEGPKP